MREDGPQPGSFSSSPSLSEDVLRRLRPLRLLCVDVDGVLSDGFLYFSGHDGSFASHKKKLAARTRSLLVPYLVWSA